jgi:hypothetical protein
VAATTNKQANIETTDRISRAAFGDLAQPGGARGLWICATMGRRVFIVILFPRTKRRHDVAPKEYPVVTDTELWRAAIVDAVTEATGQLASTNTLAYTERDRDRWALSAAERDGDDAALMSYLKQFCPDDPHIEGYPGPDERTTKRA